MRSFGSGPVPPGTDRFSNAGTDHLNGISGYRRRLSGRDVGPLTNLLFGEGLRSFRAASGSPPGEFQVCHQVTVVSIGLPIEGAPPRRNVLPAPEKTNRKSGTAPASAARPSVPGQRTSLERTGSAASRRSVELAQLGLAISGCDPNKPRLVEVQVLQGTPRAPVSSELEYEGLLREVGPNGLLSLVRTLPRLQGQGSRLPTQMPIPRFGRKSVFGPKRDTHSSILAFGPSAG